MGLVSVEGNSDRGTVWKVYDDLQKKGIENQMSYFISDDDYNNDTENQCCAPLTYNILKCAISIMFALLCKRITYKSFKSTLFKKFVFLA